MHFSLIQLGADVNLRNANQWTALDCACAFGYVKPAKALLKAGAPIEPFGKIKVNESPWNFTFHAWGWEILVRRNNTRE